jgi:hypothetical protein
LTSITHTVIDADKQQQQQTANALPAKSMHMKPFNADDHGTQWHNRTLSAHITLLQHDPNQYHPHLAWRCVVQRQSSSTCLFIAACADAYEQQQQQQQ